MLSHEDNELLVRTGPGTPMGDLMRRYWIPAVFSYQIEKPDCPPVRVGLLGEKLVAFRDSEGKPGLLDERCPHRTASMFFGRNEDCGLRCVYHGWKFDVNGRCVDLPSEPAGSTLRRKVRIKAYPCCEEGGIVWAYMGPPEFQPEFPELEWAMVPASHRYVTRHTQECNWLQGLEGGFDTSHLAFLHTGDAPPNRNIVPSQYAVVPTDFGFMAGTGRVLKKGEVLWASNLMCMPFHKIFATKPEAAHMWVPIDDQNTMLYSVDYWPDRPLTDEDLERTKNYNGIHVENIPGTDIPIHNKSNDYNIDRELQASGKSYTGMVGLGVQDASVQESMGPIADRTIEHLGASDTAIIQIRKLLLQSLKDFRDGKTPPGLDPKSYRARSTRFTLSDDVSFEETITEQLKRDYGLVASK